MLDTFSFVKMHGCGNDYIFSDCFETNNSEAEILKIAALSPKFSDRHKGIGSDGIVLILPSETADAQMRMFNADGSESAMCGNAIRCVGKYLYESGKVKKEALEIETLSGIKKLELNISDGVVTSAQVNMGPAYLKPEEIPVDLVGDSIIGRRVTIAGHRFEITCVGMGNPHAVYFHDDIDHFDLQDVGPSVECAKIFPKRINFEIAQIVSRNSIIMRVWERGSGETMACGTGACAVAVAAVLMGYCDKDTDISVKLKGGVLTIKYTDEAVFMTGGCEKVFEGTVEI
ncbi:MAG: diaminopimelate epimerase [Clostridiales bacterium]|jgi:carbamoyl-phosphate synthase large subunit|nr:diaminopimelate epimerase [Clostridiales bacterium]